MWTIEFHPKAREEFDSLPESFQDKFEKLFKRIAELGVASLPEKRSQYIGEGMWELRVMGRDGIARSLYVTKEERTVRILVSFVKKTQKTPKDKIELATKRRFE